MPNIQITVQNKIAQLQGNPDIVCGNSDYTVTFDFDAEWDAYTEKTMCVKFCRYGKKAKYEVLFTGDSCAIPPVYDVDHIDIGVYAGDIRTSTGAIVECRACITDGNPVHADPPQDIYNQLLERLNEIGGGGGAPTLITTSAPYYYNPAQQGIGTAEIVKEAENGSFD